MSVTAFSSCKNVHVFLVEDDLKGLDKDLSLITVPQKEKKKPQTCFSFPSYLILNLAKN